MVIRITFKRLVLILLTFIVGLNVYLCETNYWFDRKLERMAGQLLREVIIKGMYRIPEEKTCSLETSELIYDSLKLADNLLGQKYNVKALFIGVIECPMTDFRMSGNRDTDINLFDTNHICSLEDRYQEYNKTLMLFQKLLNNYSNFQVYNFYKNSHCQGHAIFKENTEKYKDKLIGIKGDNFDFYPHGGFEIIKYKNYYYLIHETSAIQPHAIGKTIKDSYLIFKKLTLEQLMRYDNGSYWKLIKDYNIKID